MSVERCGSGGGGADDGRLATVASSTKPILRSA